MIQASSVCSELITAIKGLHCVSLDNVRNLRLYAVQAYQHATVSTSSAIVDWSDVRKTHTSQAALRSEAPSLKHYKVQHILVIFSFCFGGFFSEAYVRREAMSVPRQKTVRCTPLLNASD